MQIDKQNIQRPSLITPCLDKELNPDNSFITYIETSSNSSHTVHKNSVTSDNNNIEKSLKTNKFGVKRNFKDMSTQAKYQSAKLTRLHFICLRNKRDLI